MTVKRQLKPDVEASLTRSTCGPLGPRAFRNRQRMKSIASKADAWTETEG